MFGIQSEIIRSAAFALAGSLLAAAFMGFSLLKSYEEFRKGIEKKSRLRMWMALTGFAFIVIFFATIFAKAAK